jgi:hypothetical protein
MAKAMEPFTSRLRGFFAGFWLETLDRRLAKEMLSIPCLFHECVFECSDGATLDLCKASKQRVLIACTSLRTCCQKTSTLLLVGILLEALIGGSRRL